MTSWIICTVFYAIRMFHQSQGKRQFFYFFYSQQFASSCGIWIRSLYAIIQTVQAEKCSWKDSIKVLCGAQFSKFLSSAALTLTQRCPGNWIRRVFLGKNIVPKNVQFVHMLPAHQKPVFSSVLSPPCHPPRSWWWPPPPPPHHCPPSLSGDLSLFLLASCQPASFQHTKQNLNFFCVLLFLHTPHVH